MFFTNDKNNRASIRDRINNLRMKGNSDAPLPSQQFTGLTELLGGDHAGVVLLGQLNAVRERYAADKAQIDADANLSETGKAAALQTRKAALQAQLKPLQERLAAITPKVPTRTAPVEPTQLDLMLAQKFGQMTHRERNAMTMALLNGDEAEMAAALVRAPASLSGVNPAVAATIRERLNPNAQAEASAAACYGAEVRLHKIASDAVETINSELS